MYDNMQEKIEVRNFKSFKKLEVNLKNNAISIHDVEYLRNIKIRALENFSLKITLKKPKFRYILPLFLLVLFVKVKESCQKIV